METMLQDIRHAARALARRPVFTLAALVCLALGIGANAAIFSVVDGILLSPPTFKEPERLVRIYDLLVKPGSDPVEASVTPPNFVYWRDHNRSFERLAAMEGLSFSLTGDGEPERVQGAAISADMLPLYGIEPVLGRLFTPEEDRVGANRVVVLSQGLWQRRFGSDPEVVGKVLTLNGVSHTVIGVIPLFYTAADDRLDLFTPLALDPQQEPRRTQHYLRVVGRLKPGVTLEQAKAEISTLAHRLEQISPESNTGWTVRLVSLRDRVIGDIRPALLVLLAAVALILLIACVNVANLQLARAVAQEREIAVRTAIGASRRRLVQQLITESLLLSLGGGVLGLLLAWWSLPALVALSAAEIPRFQEIAIDLRVLGFTFGIAVLIGVVFGTVPAARLAQTGPQPLLREAGRGGAGGSRRGRLLESVFVVAEVAFAMVLLVAAGLMIKSFQHLRSLEPGFRTERMLALRLDLPSGQYGEPEEQTAFLQTVTERLEALPGIEAAATTTLPMADRDRNRAARFTIEGRPPAMPGEALVESYRMVSPNYLQMMGITLVKGRYFDSRDRADAPGVVIVSESMANTYWPGEDVLGKRLRRGGPDDVDRPWLTVVGVVKDVKDGGLTVTGEGDGTRLWYLPFPQNPTPMVSLVLRTTGDPASAAGAARREVWAVDKNLPVHTVNTMEQILLDSIARQRLSAILLGTFSLLGLLLAAVGLYGVLAYTVGQRTGEIGLRMALGARAPDVLRLVIGRGMALTLVGLALGLIGALALTRLMASLLHDVSPTDPSTLAGISLVLVAVALLASYLPARKATKVEPTIALRAE